MDAIAIKGKAIWSNPIVQKRMGAKDALVKIKDLKCGEAEEQFPPNTTLSFF